MQPSTINPYVSPLSAQKERPPMDFDTKTAILGLAGVTVGEFTILTLYRILVVLQAP